jgi:hypothetical protein
MVSLFHRRPSLAVFAIMPATAAAAIPPYQSAGTGCNSTICEISRFVYASTAMDREYVVPISAPSAPMADQWVSRMPEVP